MKLEGKTIEFEMTKRNELSMRRNTNCIFSGYSKGIETYEKLFKN